MARVQLTVRYKCREKKERVDAFACEFENIDFSYNPRTGILNAEIPVLCPKCGKIHFLKKTTHAQEIEG